MKPRVGVGILNYNGAQFTIKCLEHLQEIEWPLDRLEIVVVDNGSTDDSVAQIRSAHPNVKLVASPVNRGFAGGSNLAIKSMKGVDYVALLNNDTFVEPDWLEPLVDALESDPNAGAACPKILFRTTYVDLILESPTFRPIGIDRRDLGVRISAFKVGEEERFPKCHFPDGFWPKEPGYRKERLARWTNGKAVLRVPIDRQELSTVCSMRVAAETTKPLLVRVGDHTSEFEVQNQPGWVSLKLSAEPFDIINNAGSVLVGRRDSADRGINQPDRGQFDEPSNVFAWCGCSVLLSSRYLEDVGLFDESLFLYYEDFDLSWRGQQRGWTYAYVPRSVVRHCHASTTGENSDLFNFYVWRNRLLVLVKNAPLAGASREVVRYGSQVLNNLWADMRAGTRSPHTLKQLKAYGSFLYHAPLALLKRAGFACRIRFSRNWNRALSP